MSTTCKTAHYHVRALRHIRRCVSVDDAKAVATALVSSRLDYCNSVLSGTSQSNLKKNCTGFKMLLFAWSWRLQSVNTSLQARLPSTSWTAATPHRTLPVVSDFDLLAATISSYHDIVAARSAVGRSPSPVRWPGMHCLTTSETRHSVPTVSGRR